MLSFTQGQPIAAICGGPYDKKVLRLAKEGDEPDRKLEDEDVFDLLDEEDFRLSGKKQLKALDYVKLKKALELRQEPLDEHLVPLYRKAQNKIKGLLKSELDIACGTMFILPTEAPERIFIAGKSGSGKSCLTSMYMNEYKRMFPDRNIYLISRHTEEPAYQHIPHIAIPVETFDIDLKTDAPPIELEELQNSLVVFDDCDHLQQKNIKESIGKLCHAIISHGRKFNVHTLWLNHQLMDYNRTRDLLMEANKVVFFNTGDNYHSQQYLKRYAGFGTKLIKKILSIRSRWIMLALTIPNYIVHEHGAFVINPTEEPEPQPKPKKAPIARKARGAKPPEPEPEEETEDEPEEETESEEDEADG